MSLVRLTPLIRTTDLGWLRLSQDDLAHMVRLVGTIEDAEVIIESGGYKLTDDVRTDLPKLGKRVSDFTIRAFRPEETQGIAPVVSVEITTNRSQIIAEDPDLHALGVVEALRAIADQRRRMPMWLGPYFRSEGSLGFRRGVMQVIAGGALAGLAIALFTFSSSSHHLPGKVAGLLLLLAMVALLGSIVVGSIQARTVIYTAPGAEVPTFWEQYRVEIAIHIVVGTVFFVLGLIVGHL